MELYTLDDLLRRDQVVDQFESLIWTERYSAFGDFELVVHSTFEMRAILTAGTLCVVNTSWRVMRIKTTEKTRDSDGRALLKIKGEELVFILNDRVATDSLTGTAPWVITDTPANVARYMFDQICRVGTPNPLDYIPFLQPGTVMPASTIPEPSTEITWTQERDTLYNAEKKLCDLYDLGFRLVRNFDTSQLYFDIYSGSDRTTGQTILAPVVFSAELDNLQNTTEFKSISDTKNVAYVFSPAGNRVVYGLGVDPEVEGFERQVLLVSSDLPEGTANWEVLLDQLGTEELSKHRSFQAFDGEFNQNSSYKYGRDYELGDLVEMRDADGVTNIMRVTEQIFVDDQQGERSYPTLSMGLFINPGSWLAWDYNQVWSDLGFTEYWADQP